MLESGEIRMSRRPRTADARWLGRMWTTRVVVAHLRPAWVSASRPRLAATPHRLVHRVHAELAQGASGDHLDGPQHYLASASLLQPLTACRVPEPGAAAVRRYVAAQGAAVV